MTPETEKEGIFIFTDYHKLIDEKLDMYSPIKAHEVFKTFIDSNLSDEELKKEIFLQYGKTSLFLAAYFNNLNSFLSYADPEEYIPIENLPVFGRIKSFAKQYSSTLSLIWQMLEADDEFDQWVLLQKSNQLSDPELYGILTSWTHRNDIFSYFNKLRMMYNINLVSGTVYRESLYGKPHNYIAELMNDRYIYNSDGVSNSEKNPQQKYNEQTVQLIYTTSSEDNIKNKAIPRRKNLPISFLYYWDPKHPMTHQLTQPYTREKTLEVPMIYCDIAAGALVLTVLYTIASYFL